MRIAIIIGHSAEKQGAQTFNKMTEWAWNLDMAAKYLVPGLKEHGIEGRLFWRDYRAQGLDIKLQELSNRVAEWGAHAAIELHLNAFDGVTKIRRCEALYGEMEGSLRMASLFVDSMQEYALDYEPVFDKKLVRAVPGVRGYQNIKFLENVDIPAALLEPCFVDTDNEVSRQVVGNPEEYAELLVRVLKQIDM